MTRPLPLRLILALAAVMLLPACRPPAPAPAAPAPPALVVILTVDQLKADYLSRFDGQWRHGMRRLLEHGAVFADTRFPYLNTVTCAGHATIATGSVPATHGVILNAWYRRTLGRQASCTHDETVTTVPYDGAPEGERHSAAMLQVPTIGDRLRDRTPGSRVVTLSLKPRSAIMLGGHQPTAVTWFGSGRGWATSSAFADAPVPEVAAWVAAHPVDRFRTETWERSLGPGDYAMPDDGAGERALPGWTAEFPHPLAGAPGTPEDQFYELWQASPYADEYLGAMAAGLVESMGLGRQDTPDYLGVSFSSLDLIGHNFGPDSQEVQDALVRLDRTLGTLFNDLDRLVGPDRWVVALSSDHGVSPVPEARRLAGLDAGRIPTRVVGAAVDAALATVLGPGPHVARVDYTEVYLTDETRARLTASPDAPDAITAALEAIRQIPGIEAAFESRTIAGARQDADPLVRAAAHSHHPGQSGDLVAIPRPYWFFVTGPTAESGSAATHGTHHDYDVAVPLIFMGAPFAPGRYDEPASPADLAPTLAATIDLPMPGVDGRVLERARRR
ncbi:MAG: alkaline phosphatase family protein [Vicinamibacterales bacterium]|nr:alkaline phosphatase family protein [Vicinamibacterales bacterium]